MGQNGPGNEAKVSVYTHLGYSSMFYIHHITLEAEVSLLVLYSRAYGDTHPPFPSLQKLNSKPKFSGRRAPGNLCFKGSLAMLTVAIPPPHFHSLPTTYEALVECSLYDSYTVPFDSL